MTEQLEPKEKIVAGLNESEWKERYSSFMRRRTMADEWFIEESADVAWSESTDEMPEQCAEDEISCWGN